MRSVRESASSFPCPATLVTETPHNRLASDLALLSGGGQTGAIVPSHAWVATILGEPAGWSQPLRTSVSIVLNMSVPAAILWGPTLVLVCNDKWSQEFAGTDHVALGAPLKDLLDRSDVSPLTDLARASAAYFDLAYVTPTLQDRSESSPNSSSSEFVTSPILGENGAIAGVFCIQHTTSSATSPANRESVPRQDLSEVDFSITSRAQSEASLSVISPTKGANAFQNAEGIELALAAGAIIGTWAWDLTTDAFTVDEAFACHFGFPDDMPRTGLPLAQVVQNVHPSDRDGLDTAIQRAIQRGGPYAHQYRVRRNDGNYYWLEANGRVDHDADGKPLRFPGVLIDVQARLSLVQERDRAFDELRQLNEQLEQRVTERTADLLQVQEALRQSQKMEAIGQLTGGLAHDFNNLLAGISGALDLISLRLEQGRYEGLEKYVTSAQSTANRAAALTHRLLAFARRQTLLPEVTDVSRLVGGMLDLIQRTVGPGVLVRCTSGPQPWLVLVDRSQLENALLNLCINARDAMPGGGQLDVQVALVVIDASVPSNLDVPDGTYVALSVVDTGTGMTPEILEKAFDPFFTTKPLGEGTGLGLSMIYGFAKQSGGHVRISSALGMGSSVTIYLPVHMGVEAPSSAPASDAALAPLGQGKTIAFVDDEPSIRLLFKDVLEDAGYHVLEAADSITGLALVRSDAKIDLLVTDVGLPGGINGRQLADAARLLRPSLPILFITGFAEGALLEDRHLAGGMSVLTKPFGVSKLVERLADMLGERAQDH